MQSHQIPFTPQNKNLQSNQCVSPMMAQSNHKWPVKQTKHKDVRNEQSNASTDKQT